MEEKKSKKGRIIGLIAGSLAVCMVVPMALQRQPDAEEAIAPLVITAEAVDSGALADLSGELAQESLSAAKERVITTASAYAEETAAKEKAAEEAAAAAAAAAAATRAQQQPVQATTTAAASAAPNGNFQSKPYENFTSRQGKIASSQNINSDVKGWIYVPGTNIDYPILQDPNSDLSYYLHRNIYKNYDQNGVIWTGPGTSFSRLNRFTTIYGHNWKNCYWPIRVRGANDVMFEQLAGYHYLSTAQSYPYFYFSTENEDYTVVIFACFYARASKFYYWGNNGTQSVVNEAKNRSLHDFNVDVDVDTDKIITLSTCTRMYSYGADQKFVVMGRILRDGESVEALSVTNNADHWNP